jgi:hypothetical protein
MMLPKGARNEADACLRGQIRNCEKIPSAILKNGLVVIMSEQSVPSESRRLLAGNRQGSALFQLIPVGSAEVALIQLEAVP